MRQFRVIFFALLITSLMVSAVSAQDKSGALQTLETGLIGVKDVLESGDVIEGVFEGGSNAHLYAFNGSAGDLVTISMTQPEGAELDPYIVLMGPNGEMIASDDDSGEDISLSSLIDSAELPVDGTYFVLATSYVYIDNILVEVGDEADDQEAGETYILTIDGATTASVTDPEAFAVSTVPVAVGDSITAESTAEQPLTYYVLEGEEGDRLTLTAESDEFDSILHVFAPSGDRIAVNNDDPESATLDAAIYDLVLPQDGTYLILATDVFFYNAGLPDEILEFTGGEYTLTIQ